jgi:ABC-type uncharacterized transport system fused permease/ATPase subunit
VDDNLWALLILIIIVSLACVALAVVLDKRSQRGYALGALALGTLVLDLRASSAIYWQEDLNRPGLTFVIVWGGLSVALMLTLGAIGETLIARQWWWFGFVVIVSVVPALLSLTPSDALERSLLDSLGLPAEAGYLVALLPSALVAFAYAMARSIRRPLAG